ncbi:MAG TPA: enoyl-CoA hydratase-related protein [Stellaceae bacterium]|jgi:enoyl-CoA hydratase/carnithine racemase
MEIRVDAPKPHITLVTIAYEARRNAMTRAMLADLAELWDRLDSDPECRAVIMTGAGERSFCVGADISGDLSASPEMAHVINRALLKDTPFSKPIIAAINGDCVGGGVELLLSTDIRMAVPAARFGLPEVKWSIYPFGGATVKLARQIGHVHAMDLLLTGRLVDAAFAEKIGLINGIVEPDRLMTWALETADAIAANSPSAVQAVKEQLSTTSADFAKSREALEQTLGDRVRTSTHFTEGVAAFREKRRPDYS